MHPLPGAHAKACSAELATEQLHGRPPSQDADARGAAGVTHLLSGVRAEAQKRWNESHPGTELALVGLELDLEPAGAALLAAPTPAGALQRLRARRLGSGAIELLPRDILSAGKCGSAVAWRILLSCEW